MLTKDDFKTPTWQRVTEHLQTQLTMARQQNDKHLSAEETAALRGRISALKELLNLPNR
jgi:hypothetical protein